MITMRSTSEPVLYPTREMSARHLLIPHTVLIALTAIVAAAATVPSPVYASPAKKPAGKVFLLLQNTVWAANHRLLLTPAIMQLDDDHQDISVQYTVADQMVYVWNKDRKEYAKSPLNSWLKSFRNMAVVLSWPAGLRRPVEITPIEEWHRKAKLYVYDNVKITRSYYSSDIGKPRKRQRPAIAHIKAIRLDGIAPEVGLVLTHLYGFPESTEIPLEAYILRDKRKTRESIHTLKLEENPEVKLPSVFVPPKGYKQLKDFQRVLAPKDTDVNAIF